MGSIFDYIAWRGDLTLEQSPFNAVDNVILTHLSYLPLDGIVPGPGSEPGTGKNAIIDAPAISDAAKVLAAVLYDGNPQKKSPKPDVIFKKDPALLEALGNSRRFGNMKLAGFVNQIDPVEEKQFAALTILTGDGCAFIAYRGTDDSIVGWKEDFNMAFSDEVPAQGEAVQYLKTMAGRFRMPLRIGGHSKGGNLASYAASFCPARIQKRITEVYLNDAPGFSDKVINTEGYQAIKSKFRSFIPQGSVVGLLFEHDCDHTVVKSSNIGLFQHDIYSWEVMGNDLVRLPGINKGSRFMADTIKEWLADLDMKQRRDSIEALFTILNSTEAKSFFDFGSDWLKNSAAMLKTIKNLDNHSRDMLGKTLKVFVRAARENIPTLISR